MSNRRVVQPVCLLLMAAALPLGAQQTVAPSPGQAGSPRGQDVEGYNIVNSFEAGYRFAAVTGDRGLYRSDVNYRNGLRLLGSSFSMHSKNGHGAFFDEIVLYTQGLGNDPYESATLRIQKNMLYRYDLLWRKNEYFNPGLAVADGRHAMDTERRLQDHDFTLLPQSAFKLRLGYTRNVQDGPALSTVNLFDTHRGDEFTLFSGVRRQRNEFRIGTDMEFAGWKFAWTHFWDNFREDTPYSLANGSGANAADRSTLTGFQRSEPYHGNTPVWRGNLRRDGKTFAVNARLTYAGGRRNFTMDERALGTDRFAAAANRQILVTGNARRPVTAGDLSLSLTPGLRFTLVNNTSVHSTRIDGDSVYRETFNGSRFDDTLYFRYLGIRTIANTTDANFRIASWLSVNSGYHYSTRRIRSNETDAFPPFDSFTETHEQETKLHAGLLGIRLKPSKPLTIALDAEIARADRPFTPVSDKNLHNLGGRVQYKTKTFLASAVYREHYNFNSTSLTSHSARGRSSAFDFSWTPRGWFAIDAGYAKIHLDTVSGIAFFAGGRLQDNQRSIYVSNIHSANLGARFAIRKWAEVYAGYSVNRDTGDGRAAAAPAPPGTPAALLDPVQTFPLRYESPLARLSVRVLQKVRWNFGWQYYRYAEDFRLNLLYPGYHAHTGYTSLLWAF